MSILFSASYPSLTLTVNFSGATWTDISDYVRSVDTDRPSSDETGRYSPGMATIVLDNRDGRFTPANLSGPYVSAGVSQVLPEIGVRLTATWSAVTYNLFVGIVEDWQDEFSSQGKDAVTVLTLVDPLAQVAEWNGSAVTEVGDGELSDVRIGRILDAAGFSAPARLISTGDELLVATDLEGNGLDQLHSVVDSEGGALFFEPNAVVSTGGIVFLGRSTRVTNSRYNTAQATFSNASTRFRDPIMSSGRERIVRTAAFSSVDGVEQVTGSGNPRVTRTGMLNTNDTGVLAVAELTVAAGSPLNNYRIKGLSVDPVVGTSWATVLALRMQDRCAVTAVAAVSGVSVSRGVFVDGIAHHIRPMQWSIDYTFQSATAWAGFSASVYDTGLYDTATYFY